MNACCQDQNNLTVIMDETVGTDRRWHHRCAVCGANHYGMTVDPIPLGVEGKPMNETLND